MRICKDIRIYETEPLPYLIDVFDMLTRAIKFCCPILKRTCLSKVFHQITRNKTLAPSEKIQQ